MKNQFLLIILAAMFLVSASVVSVNTPATPKVTLVKTFASVSGVNDEIAEYISAKAKQGFITKCITMSDGKYFAKGIVVMEKY